MHCLMWKNFRNIIMIHPNACYPKIWVSWPNNLGELVTTWLSWVLGELVFGRVVRHPILWIIIPVRSASGNQHYLWNKDLSFASDENLEWKKKPNIICDQKINAITYWLGLNTIFLRPILFYSCRLSFDAKSGRK